MITRIACISCGGHDLVRYQGANRQLQCINCESDRFHVFHDKEEQVNEVRETIKFIKTANLDELENFDEIINKLGKNFEGLFQ